MYDWLMRLWNRIIGPLKGLLDQASLKPHIRNCRYSWSVIFGLDCRNPKPNHVRCVVSVTKCIRKGKVLRSTQMDWPQRMWNCSVFPVGQWLREFSPTSCQREVEANKCLPSNLLVLLFSTVHNLQEKTPQFQYRSLWLVSPQYLGHLELCQTPFTELLLVFSHSKLFALSDGEVLSIRALVLQNF